MMSIITGTITHLNKEDRWLHIHIKYWQQQNILPGDP